MTFTLQQKTEITRIYVEYLNLRTELGIGPTEYEWELAKTGIDIIAEEWREAIKPIWEFTREVVESLNEVFVE